MERRPIPAAGRGMMAGMATIGLGLSLMLIYVKLRLELDPSYESSCNFGSAFNCDVVQTSAWSTVWNYPLALWGAVTYSAVLLLIARLGDVERGRSWLTAIACGGVVAVLHSAYLAWISSTVIGSFCVFCVGMYTVNVGLTAAAWWLLRGGTPQDRRNERADLLQPRTWATPLVAIALSAAVAVLGYELLRSSMTSSRLAMAQAELALAHGDAAQPGATPSTAAKTAAAAGQATPPTPSTQVAVPAATDSAPVIHQHPSGFRYGDAVTNKGRTYFDVPITEHDFVLGPADAKVTVVEFADFECGYCRSLTNNIKPLKQRYEGRVRWVFKHFPLDNACNKVMKGTMHPQACDAAKATNCAGLQGRFWQLHDRIYDESLRLNVENLRTWAIDVGVDGAKWDACMADGALGHAKTNADTVAGRFARIAGTPRTYVAGHLVPGIVSTEVFAYYLDAALARAEAGSDAAVAVVPEVATERAHGMVKVALGEKPFWIDAYEATLDAEGRALSRAGVPPAEVSWFEAQSACALAGKRLCAEREWVSSCAGAVAVDNNSNSDLTDDAVEGSLYAYGPFHGEGGCHDDADSESAPIETGTRPGCRTPSGIFDQCGNVAEWTGNDATSGRLLGGDYRYGAKATCMVGQERFGLGYRNRTTGFRCCADNAVPPPQGAVAVDHADHGAAGDASPVFSVQTRQGTPVDNAWLQGKVTIVSFFASWCGPCRREMPELERFYGEQRAAGLHILAIGVDTVQAQSEAFVDEIKPTFDIAFDPDARSMGAFGVKGMPTTFLVGRDGRIVERLVGINGAKVKAFQTRAIEELAKK